MAKEISFVIPVFNEERILAKQLDCIQEFKPAGMTTEIIVVDNCSTDNSAEVARSKGVDAVIQCSGTVSAVRNLGVEHSSGSILVFLDADVFLTDEWKRNIGQTLSRLAEDPLIVTGSWVCIPSPGSWIERTWFARLEETPHSHINSGHLIISRQAFEMLGGFDENLVSGEDYDLSVRAETAGCRLNDNKALKVVHHGYPKTVGAFFKRELWHGEGDYLSVKTFLASPIAIAGFVSVLVLACGIILSIGTGELSWLGYGMIPLAVATGSAAWRWRPSRPSYFPVVILLSCVYFLARGLALFKRIGTGMIPRKQQH